MSFKAVFRSVTLFTVFTFVLTLCSFSLLPVKAGAEVSSPIYVGEVMADASGKVFVLSSSGERLKMDSNPVPIFADSTILAEKGVAIISLAPDGLVELTSGSEAGIKKLGERNIVSLKSGSLRFTVPSSDILLVAIPSEGISITPANSLASTSGATAYEGGTKAGLVELREDGSAIVTSTKGSLMVSTVDGKSTVLTEGNSVMIARAEGTSRAKKVAGYSKTHDYLMLGMTVGVAGAVAVISNNTDSGGGWVASGP